MRILAIDDHQDNLTALQAVLSDTLPEATVLTALNGPDGLDLARAEDPDVVLLDIVMPGMDGYEVCRGLKADPVLQAIPVLFLTADRTDRASRVKALEAGAEGFLSKPFDDLELTAQIRSMVKIKAAVSRQRTENERLAGLVEERTRSLVRELDERKRVESELHASEQRFRAIFEQAGDCLMVLDPNTPDGIPVIVDANAAACREHGYTREDYIGRPVSDIDDQEGRSLCLERTELIMSGKPLRIENIHVRSDGTTFPASIRADRVDIEGRRSLIFTTERDITERRRADIALRASERELLEAQRLAGIGSWSYDPVTQQPEWSAGMFRIWGLDPKLGVPAYSDHKKLIHADDYQRFDDALQEAVRHGTPYEMEVRICRPDGRTATIITTGEAQRNAAGDVVSLRGTNQDITERKEREEAVRASGSRLQDIVSSMGGWVWETGENGTCTYMSQKGIDFLGVPLEDILGQTALDFMSPDEAERVASLFSEIVASKAPIVDLEYWIVRPDGERRDLLSNGFPILDDAGNLKGYRGVDRDITGRKQAGRLRQLSSEILGILNEPIPFEDTAQRIFAAIKQETGFDAVGMRLQEGDDFPYFSQDGFPAEFIEAENALAERDERGDVCRDKNGQACLSCTCGLVISGKTDAGSPLFTPGGSCWTNDSSLLLGLTAEEDPRSQPRNRCIHDGYASVALIPIRANQEIIGLLHLNDRRKGCFTLRQIQFFEGICSSIGIALLRNRAQDQLRASEEEFRVLVENMPIGLVVHAPDSTVLFANPLASQLLGQTPGEIYGRTAADPTWFFIREDGERMLPVEYPVNRALANDPVTGQVLGIVRGDGSDTVWVQCNVHSVRDSEGRDKQIIVTFLDISQRVQAEERLRVSEQTYRNQFAMNSSVMLLIDPADGAILDANAAALAFYGCSHDQLLAMRITDINTLPTPRVQEAMRAVPQEEGGQFQFQHRLADGSLRDVNVSTSRIQMGERTVLHSIISDITKRKRAEESVRRNEARLRGIVSILQHHTETPEEFLHNALEEAIKLTESTIGYIFSYSEDRRQLVLDTYSKEVSKECAIAVPQKVYELDKTGIWGEVIRQRKPFLLNDFKSPHPLTKGCPEGHVHLDRFMSVPVFREDRIVAVVGVANKASDYDESDVLQLSLLMDSIWRSVAVREAEAALRESEERFQQLFDHMADGVAVYQEVDDGQDFVFVDMNETGQSFSKVRLEDVVGRRVTDVFPGVAEIGLLDVFRRVWRTGQAEDHPLTDYVDDRIEHWVENYVYKLPSGLIVAIYSDTTAQKQAEEEADSLQIQLQQAQKMDSIGRLAGGVAHDFNNMLEVIIGNTEFALDDADPAEPLCDDLREVLKAARRSADLTRQLLAFARKQVISPRVLDLNETVEGMLKMLRRLIGENINLDWQSGAGLWPVMMDPSQIDQILANLCVNGRDAIAGVGKITIKTRNCTLDGVYCSTHVDMVPGEFAQLTISDNGCGMDQETAAHIFEPFFTTKAMGKGTGLGLATVYGIVKQNNGCIDTYSRPGLGTTFRIHLPRHKGDAGESVTDDAEPPLRGTETVLLVEDELAILKMAQKMLEKQGYTVLAAPTPAEAIRLVTAHADEIHLLIVDVIMPEMNGQDLATRLLSLNRDY